MAANPNETNTTGGAMEEEKHEAPFGLGDRMKHYEKLDQRVLSKEVPYIARLDGHSFSKFTKGLTIPFDARFTEAMNRTTKDMVTHFAEVDAGYVQSDEISLFVFPKYKRNTPDEITDLSFGGRAEKLVTIYASYATARFNYHMSALAVDVTANSDDLVEVVCGVDRANKDHVVSLQDENVLATLKPLGPKCVRQMTAHIAHFDGRVFSVPNEMECLNNLLWRLNYDCIRNSISKLACTHFSYKENFKKSSPEKLKMLASKGVNWEDLYPPFKYGCLFKKEQYTKVVECSRVQDDTEDAEQKQVTRTRVVAFSTKIGNLKENDDRKSKWIQFLKARYVDEEEKRFVLSQEKETDLLRRII